MKSATVVLFSTLRSSQNLGYMSACHVDVVQWDGRHHGRGRQEGGHQAGRDQVSRAAAVLTTQVRPRYLDNWEQNI